MQNPVTKVYRAYDHLFLNSSAMVIEYHDVIRMNWFNILYFLAHEHVADEYFDTSIFEGMSNVELMEWYVMRPYRNILMNIPTKLHLPEDLTKREAILDKFLFDMSRIPQLYALPAELNFHEIFLKFLSDGKNLVSHYYIYGGLYKDDLLEAQIKQTYGKTGKISFLYGDFQTALEGVNKDATYIISDIEKLADLVELDRLECASVLIADGFRYNFLPEDDSELKMDINLLLQEHTCRISFFNNLEETQTFDEYGNRVDPISGRPIPKEIIEVLEE